MKKIVYSIICASVFFSCSKDEIEIQKNTSTSWEIDKRITDDDIRNRIGYDPRYSYILAQKKELQFTIPTIGKEIFGKVDQVQQLTVELTNPAEKDVKVSIHYEETLYPKIKSNYEGYELGAKNNIKVVQQELTIKAGERSVAFEVSIGDISEKNNIIIPFVLKQEGDDSVKLLNEKSSTITFVVSKASALNTIETSFNASSDSSSEIQKAFNDAKDKNAAIYRGEVLHEEIKIGKIDDNVAGITMTCSDSRYSYIVQYNFDINTNDQNQIVLSNAKGGKNFGYYLHLKPFVDLIVNNSPYNVEKISSGKVKLTSAKNPSIWFNLNI